MLTSRDYQKASNIREYGSYRTSFEKYGLCSKCVNFVYIITKLMTEIVYCDAHDPLKGVKPNTHDPIMLCSHFYEKGQLSLDAMASIATKIDVQKKKLVGFSPNGDREEVDVKIKAPKGTDEDE